MKFGVREICDVVFKAKSTQKIGNREFKPGQPVLYIDTAKTSTVEGAATTVYATGGRGNTRLIAWEGEKTLTFTVEDALLSPIGFAVLSGAGLIKKEKAEEKVHMHMTVQTTADADGIDLTHALAESEEICKTAPFFVVVAEADGSITGEMIEGLKVDDANPKKLVGSTTDYKGKPVFVDFYVEAATLFREQATGRDLPAELTFPNVKIQSNFTFNMASTGDPSTFSFTMDAFPGYTYFNQNKKVLCAMQILEDASASDVEIESVFSHSEEEADHAEDSVAVG